MSYLALYRRFRPDTFDKVIGQDAIVKTLTNQIKSDKIGHAYLFCGARGTGKTTLAKIFAKAVNCTNSVDGSPCGKCEACLNLSNPANLNVIEMDAASNNKVENVRSIRDNVLFPPVGVRYKVYIIDEVHMLTTEAFNALLKTLEEPPKHAVFILATTEPHKLPATILSRCMRFDFRLVGTERIANLISGIYDEIGKKYTKEAVTAIAKAGEGSVRDALSVADLCVSVGDGELEYSDVLTVLGATDTAKTDALAKAVLSGDVGGVLSITDELASLGKSVGLMCKDLVNYFRDLTVIKSCDTADKILSVPQDVFNEMKKTSDIADGHGLLRVLEIVSGIENDIRYSSQPRAVFETALIKAAMPSVDYNIDALLSRMSKLETAFSEIKENGSVTVNTVTTATTNNGEILKEINDLKRELSELKNSGIKEEIKPVPLVRVNDAPLQTKSVEDIGFDDIVPPPEDDGCVAYFGDDNVTCKNIEIKAESEYKTPISKSEKFSQLKPTASVDVVKSEKKEQERNIPSNIDSRRVWGTVVRKLRTMPGKTILWVACQEMTAEIVGNDFIIDAGGESEKKVLLKEENIKTLTELISAFGVFNVRVKGESNGDDDNGVKTKEKTVAFFGEDNVTLN